MMNNHPLRIAIVNDLEIAVAVLIQALSIVPSYKVAWIAKDGAEAVKKCVHDIPDLILMDLIMPVMNGVEATRQIMSLSPCPILVVTSSIGTNASMVFEAMGYGALDAVNTPQQDNFKALLNKILMIEWLLDKENHPITSTFIDTEQANTEYFTTPILAIGASAGGPTAIAKILSEINTHFPAAIVIVQHIDTQFTEGLAEWLSKQSNKKVEIAQSGMRLRPGKILLAGSDDHLVVAHNLQLHYTTIPKEMPYRPSVDVFFQSLVSFWPQELAQRSMALLLTGMGHDGALGMMQLKNAGWFTLAEDKKSCVVYGMPKAAIEMNAVKKSLPLKDIGGEINQFFKGSF